MAQVPLQTHDDSMIDPKIGALRGWLPLRFAHRWNHWTAASVNRSIFGAAVTVGFLTVGVKVVTALKEIVLARTFGTSDAFDAFLVAFLLPFFAISVISGSFNIALIPTLVRVRDRDGQSEAQRLLGSILALTLLLLTGITVLFWLSADLLLPMVASGFSPAKLALTKRLFYLLLPSMLVCGLSATWSAVLNAGHRFALAAITPVATPVLTIGVLYSMGAGWGIYSIVIATLGGYAVEAMVLGWGLQRQGFSLIPRWHGFDEAVKEVLGQYAPVAAGAVLMSGSLVINQAMAAMIGPGSVSRLNYGNKLVSFILGIGSLALGTAVMPYFSRMVAAKNCEGARRTLASYCRLLMIVSAPLTAVLVAASEPLVGALFQRGNFMPDDTRLVAPVAACFALQIPFYMVGQIGVRLLIALGRSRAVTSICLVNLIVNVVGNWVLIRGMGVAGIALSTSIVYLLSSAQILYSVEREFRRRQKSGSYHA